jgi:hypothetical protein
MMDIGSQGLVPVSGNQSYPYRVRVPAGAIPLLKELRRQHRFLGHMVFEDRGGQWIVECELGEDKMAVELVGFGSA